MVRRWIKRIDGIIQRYHVKYLKAFKERYVYDKAAKAWVKPPPAPPPLPKYPYSKIVIMLEYKGRKKNDLYIDGYLEGSGEAMELEKQARDWVENVFGGWIAKMVEVRTEFERLEDREYPIEGKLYYRHYREEEPVEVEYVED